MKKILGTVLASCAIAAATSALAVGVSFDTIGNTAAPMLTYSTSLGDVDVSPVAGAGGAVAPLPFVIQRITGAGAVRGLGVDSNASDGNMLDDGDTLVFDLPADVILVSIELARTGVDTAASNYILSLDGVEQTPTFISGENSVDNPSSTVVPVGAAVSQFSITASDNENGIWVRAITIEPVNEEPSDVPLPATAPLLLGGLIAGAALIRRKRKA